MAEIRLLDSNTIDKIAAGEVVERPSSVVKELVENAMDAGATAVTVEIRDGGCSFIRVTDNGGGIEKDQLRKAFSRHATSKIRSAEDLFHLQSLGFRGEALSSIAAVSMVEVITKTKEQLTGVHFRLEGDQEKEFTEVGAPDGTTIIVRELFFNTPVRKKFLKSPATEGSYISDLMEHLALSRPHVAFQFMINGNVKFHTSGNGDLKEIIYRIYGRQLVRELIPFHAEGMGLTIDGFLGSPVTVRSNRNFEFFFVNGRYVRSPLLSKGLEAGYKAYLMQHKFPFALMHVTVDPENIDVNVHPSKMEIRFHDQPGIYAFLEEQVRTAMREHERIPEVTFDEPKRPAKKEAAEPVSVSASAPIPTTKSAEAVTAKSVEKPENKQKINPVISSAAIPKEKTASALLDSGKANLNESAEKSVKTAPFQNGFKENMKPSTGKNIEIGNAANCNQAATAADPESTEPPKSSKEAPQPFETARRAMLLQEESAPYLVGEPAQLDLFDGKLLSEKAARSYRILGQVFNTYWLVQYEDKLMFLDQHAAHEKVRYEALIKKMREGSVESQMLIPPMVMNLSAKEAHIFEEYASYFARMGFEIEDFGGNAVTVRSVPLELYGHCEKDFLQTILDELLDDPLKGTPSVIEEKLASRACKSAVKGNQQMSPQELTALLDQLLSLDDPYHCPHGRPTIITMSKYELEKKFRRIL